MEDPSGAVGGISDAFHKFITGDSFIQGMKDMWAKHMGSTTPAQPSQTVQDMSKQMNDQRVQDANKTYVDAASAEKIRAKVAQKLK